MAELERQLDELSKSFKEFQQSLDQIDLEPARQDSLRLATTRDELPDDQPAKDS